MKPTSLKPFKIGYSDEKIAFYPRMISLAEQEDTEQKLINISETDDAKFQKRFDLKLEAIAAWSEKVPQKVTKVRGENVFAPLVENAETDMDAVKRYFDKCTAENERVISAVYNSYLNLCSPDLDFL